MGTDGLVNFRATPIEKKMMLGEKLFPRLYNRTPPPIGLEKRFRSERPKRIKWEGAMEEYVRSDKKFARIVQAGKEARLRLEFLELRNNPIYKEFYDVMGDSLPIHPEYMHVIRVVLEHFDIDMFNIVELVGWRKTGNKAMGFSTRASNLPVSNCLNFLTYILYQEYFWNPTYVMQLLNNMSPTQFAYIISKFMRDYDNSSVIRNSYAELHAKLLRLEPIELNV